MERLTPIVILTQLTTNPLRKAELLAHKTGKKGKTQSSKEDLVASLHDLSHAGAVFATAEPSSSQGMNPSHAATPLLPAPAPALPQAAPPTRRRPSAPPTPPHFPRSPVEGAPLGMEEDDPPSSAAAGAPTGPPCKLPLDLVAELNSGYYKDTFRTQKEHALNVIANNHVLLYGDYERTVPAGSTPLDSHHFANIQVALLIMLSWVFLRSEDG